MNATPWLPGALACLMAALAPIPGRASDVPTIRLFEPPLSRDPLPPEVFFAVSKYTLTQHERETIAACLVLEAANQGEFGMRSVMAVIRSRARALPELFAPTVLRSKQFSALNKVPAGRESLSHAIARAKRDRTWPSAVAIVNDAIHDLWHDPTGGATHYTRAGERTHWTRRLAKTVTIGGHSFYR